jgi:hypothetical protein
VRFAIDLLMVYEPPVVRTVQCAEDAEKGRADESIEWREWRAKSRKDGRKTVLEVVHSVDVYQKRRVDVPRFELGNRNAERIRCFILGFQVAQRLAAWQNTRYGGGL